MGEDIELGHLFALYVLLTRKPEDIHQPRFIDLAGYHFRRQGDLRQQRSEVTRGVWIAPLLFHAVLDQRDTDTTHGITFHQCPLPQRERELRACRAHRSCLSVPYATLSSISRVYFP